MTEFYQIAEHRIRQCRNGSEGVGEINDLNGRFIQKKSGLFKLRPELDLIQTGSLRNFKFKIVARAAIVLRGSMTAVAIHAFNIRLMRVFMRINRFDAGSS